MPFQFGDADIRKGEATTMKNGKRIAVCPRCAKSAPMSLRPLAVLQDNDLFYDPPFTDQIWEKSKGRYVAVRPGDVRRGQRGHFPAIGSKVMCPCGVVVLLPNPLPNGGC